MGKYKIVEYVAYSKILLKSLQKDGSVFGSIKIQIDSRSSSAHKATQKTLNQQRSLTMSEKK